MSIEQERYDALVVDPDAHSRLRLKQATAPLYAFNEVVLLSELDAALWQLSGQHTFDVVFLSEKLTHKAISDFVKEAKAVPGGRDAAYIIILSKDDEAQKAGALMLGVHTVLVEPFSVDSLMEITRLASEVKRENTLARERMALSLLIKDLMKHIDRLSLLQASNVPAGRVLKNFKDACALLQELDEGGLEQYVEMAPEMFESAAPTSERPYTGPSQRVKKMMAAKLMEGVDKEDAGQLADAFRKARS